MTQFEDLEVEKGKATVSLAASEAAAATTTTTKEDHDVVGDEAEEGRSREESQRAAAALERPSVPRDNHGMVDNDDVETTATEDYFVVASFTPMSRKHKRKGGCIRA